MPDINYGNWICVAALILLVYVIYKDLNSESSQKKIITVAANDVNKQQKKKSHVDTISHTKDDPNINNINTESKTINTVPATKHKLASLYTDIDYEGTEKNISINEKIKIVEINSHQSKPFWYYKSLKINDVEMHKVDINFINRIIRPSAAYADGPLPLDKSSIYNIRNIEEYLKDYMEKSPDTQMLIYITITPKLKVD
jgi:hypothetical protein